MSSFIDFVTQECKSPTGPDFDRWDTSAKLPKLPVPSLQSTLERYQAVMQPILSVEKFKHMQELVKDFQKGSGIVLQKKLKERSEKSDNWAYEFWHNDMYMNIRLPLVINSNPGMSFEPQKFRDDESDFLKSWLRDLLPIDRANTRERGQPLCMDQYRNIFTRYRKPGKVRDELIQTMSSDQEKQHIVVCYKDQFFRMDVVYEGEPISAAKLLRALEQIKSTVDRDKETKFPSIGVLTSWNRTQWAISREKLIRDPENSKSLDVIESSLFILCLDDDNCSSDTERFDHMLHGTKVNAANRWYDKTLQVIVGKNGSFGLNYEHSAAEGIVVIRIFELVLKYMLNPRDDFGLTVSMERSSIEQIATPLHWNIVGDIENDICEATKEIHRLIDNLSSAVFRFTEFGRTLPKEHKISPDSFIQLALQLAYYRTHGSLVSSYESASLRRFRLGRVDNIRSQSMRVLQWVQSMNSNLRSTAPDRMAKFRQALTCQTDYMIQTITGNCLDCHLVSLREIAQEIGLETPELFTDETFSISQKFVLSTSQVPTSGESFMGYGAVVPNGYGVAYNPKPDSIIFCLTAWEDSNETDLDEFVKNLHSSLIDMRKLCIDCK